MSLRTLISVNMPPISRFPNGPWPIIIGRVFGGPRMWPMRECSACSAMPFSPIGMKPGSKARISSATPDWSAPMLLGMSCPIAFMV